jgi:hypothetical protein
MRNGSIFFQTLHIQHCRNVALYGRIFTANLVVAKPPINSPKFQCHWHGWQRRGTCEVIGSKAREKTPLGRPRRRWMDNIKVDLLERGLNVADWIGLTQDRYRWRALVNSVMKVRVP